MERPNSNLEGALCTLCNSLQAQLLQRTDAQLGDQLLPALIKALTVPSSADSYQSTPNVVSGMLYWHFENAGAKEASRYVPDVLMALEENPDGSQRAVAPIFCILQMGYARNSRLVHDHIDSVIENTVYEPSMANHDGAKVIQQVAKRCPRLL